MRKTLIALGIILGGILYATIGTIIVYLNFNYRVIQTNDGGFLFNIMFICFYHLGVYISAATFGLFLKRERYIASSSLVHGSLCSLVLSFLIILVSSIFFIFSIGSRVFYIYLGIILLFQIVVVRVVYTFEKNKSLKHFLKKIATILLMSLILQLVVCINDFPGVNAPVEVRQKWAYKKFSNYSAMVYSIQESNQIIDQVGQIKFVAPTKGRNLFVVIGGSSGPTSEFTLEVVGEKGTGIAYITTWGRWYITGVCFEYQGKKTELTKWRGSGSCN